jgi:hypothetical protein
MELSFHQRLAFDSGDAPEADIHPLAAKRSRLDSERLRLATGLAGHSVAACGLQTDCGGKTLCST